MRGGGSNPSLATFKQRWPDRFGCSAVKRNPPPIGAYGRKPQNFFTNYPGKSLEHTPHTDTITK